MSTPQAPAVPEVEQGEVPDTQPVADVPPTFLDVRIMFAMPDGWTGTAREARALLDEYLREHPAHDYHDPARGYDKSLRVRGTADTNGLFLHLLSVVKNGGSMAAVMDLQQVTRCTASYAVADSDPAETAVSPEESR